MATNLPGGIIDRMAAANAASIVNKKPETPKVQPVVSAQEIANPTPTPVPPVGTTPPQSTRADALIDNVSKNTQDYITAQSEETRKANELAGYLGTQTFDGASQRADLGKQYGIPDNLKRLTDIQTQLTKANTASNVQKAQIAGAAGQTIGQGQRELTQQDKENAFRNAGLAAEASVLQGSIETASTLVSQAMSDFYQDRQAENNNKIAQLNYYSGISDKQTAQLLENKKREYEADQKKIERVLNSVDTALASGYATPEDMRTLTNPKATDEQRLAVAQAVVSRGAVEARAQAEADSALDRQYKQAQLNKLNEPTITKRDTQIVNGKLYDMQTGELISNLSDPTSSALGQALSEGKVNNINNILASPALSSSVGTSGLSRTDPGLLSAAKRFFAGAIAGGAVGAAVGAPFAGVGAIPGAILGALSVGTVNAVRGSMSELSGDRQNFISSVDNMVKGLTLDKLKEAKGQGVTFGALSDGERVLVADAATKIGNWAITEDGSRDGKVIGYNIDEKDFKAELDNINYYAKMDAIKQGNKPEDIGVVRNPDGTLWVMNSDGTLRQLISQ